jgi:hypothetical protein
MVAKRRSKTNPEKIGGRAGGVLLVPMERMLLVFKFKPKHLNRENKQKEVRNKRKENNPYSLGST